ncbi:hypothetical protein BASA61_000173 [Batrachochytrium salamandrivorans]|nr:hypothetical protein BASA61_000173 [Batrachochytrium salamandrivorans]
MVQKRLHVVMTTCSATHTSLSRNPYGTTTITTGTTTITTGTTTTTNTDEPPVTTKGAAMAISVLMSNSISDRALTTGPLYCIYCIYCTLLLPALCCSLLLSKELAAY